MPPPYAAGAAPGSPRAWLRYDRACMDHVLAVNCASAPYLPPCMILRRPHVVAGEIPLVKAHDLRFHHLDETCLILLCYALSGASLNEGSGHLFVHAAPNDRGDGLGHYSAVVQAERVRFSQGLTHR